MHGADLVKLDEAAHYLGVSSTMLATKVAAGGVPEAVHDRNEWTIPLAELASVASRHGWLLDLTDTNNVPLRATPSRATLMVKDPIDSLAAHAAVIMAKAQATAARAKSAQLEDRLGEVNAELDQTRSESEKLKETISHLRKLNFELTKDCERSEERVKDALDQLSVEKTQRVVQAQELLELRRELSRIQWATLGWRARRRVRRRR